MNIPLTKNIFRTIEDYNEARQAVKDGTITVDELQLCIKTEIANLYNSIVSHFFGGEKINHENIYKREEVERYIEEYCNYNMHLFPILKQNGIIGVCGRGYTLDRPRFKQSEEEYNKLMHIIWDKGFYI